MKATNDLVISVGCCQACSVMRKVLLMTNYKYRPKELSDCLRFLPVVRHRWKLQIDPIISGMVRHANTCPKYSEITNPQYLHHLMLGLVLMLNI